VTTIWTGVVANEAATATATVIAGSVTQGKAVDGSGAAAEFGAGGRLAMAADGRSLLVANLNVLRKVGLDGQVSTLSGNGLLANPEALATDTAHSAVYVAGEKGVVAAGSATTSWSRYVQRIDANGIATSLKASSGSGTVYGGNAGSGGMAMGPDGLLYVTATAANQILVVDPRTGASAPYAGRPDGSAGADDGGLSVASFSHPTGLSFDAQGNLYVCDTGNHQIRKISPEGVVSSLAGTTTAGYANGQGAKARFGAPSDIDFDRFAGVLYVADGALVREVGLDGGVRTLIGGDLGYGFYGLTVDAQGALYATATGGLAGVVRISGMH
jgi:sugar lactone lactonase YvrE